MRVVPLVAAIWMTTVAAAQDAGLTALHTSLSALHAQMAGANINTPMPGAALTSVKHQLRNWVESQIANVDTVEKAASLASHLNDKLNLVSVVESKESENLFGSVDQIRFTTQADLLILTTGVGIICQYDESAYAYQ